MTEQQRNGYEDSDFRDVIAEIEEMDGEAEGIMASARGKVSAIRKRQKNKKKQAKDELAIPSAILTAALKTRKLERQMQRIAEDIPEELTEVWVDAAGQFSMFSPAEGEEPKEVAEPAAKSAAKKRQKQAKAEHDAEQSAGAEILDGLTKH